MYFLFFRPDCNRRLRNLTESTSKGSWAREEITAHTTGEELRLALKIYYIIIISLRHGFVNRKMNLSRISAEKLIIKSHS